MPLTAEQQQRVLEALQAYPERAAEIMAAAQEAARSVPVQESGTAKRLLWDLPTNEALRSLPFGFGEEVGLTDPDIAPPEGMLENIAAGAGYGVGMIPSFIATGGVGKLIAGGAKAAGIGKGAASAYQGLTPSHTGSSGMSV